ncbi:MAG: helix-turn-helix domain-containing protein [Oscillospiraceae bacterium]|jgi:putative transcriptional regulator|nr:helix-turn-helix domain-containing protein [Oscillospiraceae bacterium]
MEELTFKSALTSEEIEKNFQNIDFFSGVMAGLEEARAYAEGQAAEDTLVRKRTLPVINVSEIRESLSMTQKDFAAVLGVSRRTVEAWESGRSNPTPTAKKLMFLIQGDHSLVERL